MWLPMTDRTNQREPSAIKTPTSKWRGFIHRFAPSYVLSILQILLTNNNKYALDRWFAIVMGTGIISILLYKLPYNNAWLYWISVAIFVITIALFAIFSLTSALRDVSYKPRHYSPRDREYLRTRLGFLGFNSSLGIVTDIASVTPFWLLPIVSITICAATGGLVAGALPSPT
ncbi:uncharacterized protein N7473_006423 [Penicillium subrubescens]|uniref:uncharacterized protein n=1 Tax=Penicillium subrubescens TaxID=1316194 RepID=UPI0025454FD1|nr:uncharacterized protein N7473_006423 [Penicillium subrubescens]KAJ5897024.1 hypothetical protein N7473_006423 [Penicillium subrubescens]